MMRRCMGCMREFQEKYDICPYCGYDCDTPVKSKNHLPPGSVLQNRYLLGKVLGQGGFGITYIAWDQRLEKPVAVKEYFPTAFAARVTGQSAISCFNAESQKVFESGMQKMLNESRLLARFTDQPNIVQVLDCIEENGTAYIIMELLRGETVQSILKREGQMTLERTMQIILPILRTLESVHRTGLVHRDITPDNIFVCDDGNVKLLDFGAARFASGMDHRTLSVMLKKGFAPIEQYSTHGKQGPYTDVYAACATIYKMLTGFTPVSSTDRMSKDTLRPVTDHVDVPDGIADILSQGMQIEAADRIQSAGELYALLQEAMEEAEREDAQPEQDADEQEDSEQEETEKERRTDRVKLRKILITVAVLLLTAAIVWGTVWAVQRGQGDNLTEETEAQTVSFLPETTEEQETQPVSPFEGAAVGDTVSFGSYEQDGDAGDGEEAIEWLVIQASDDGERLLLLSRDAIEWMPYHDKEGSVTWEACHLRAWLNGTFYDNHFSAEDRERIVLNDTVNPDNEEQGSVGGAETEDHVFLLSLDEIGALDAAYLAAEPTEAAVEREAFRSEENGRTWWILRSPGAGNDRCAIVRSDSVIGFGGAQTTSAGGVRPAVWVTKS